VLVPELSLHIAEFVREHGYNGHHEASRTGRDRVARVGISSAIRPSTNLRQSVMGHLVPLIQLVGRRRRQNVPRACG